MSTFCPECNKIPVEDLLTKKGTLSNPDCSTCNGSCVVGDPEECTDEIPLCMGRAIGPSHGCTCDNGFMARAGRFSEERWQRTVRYALKEADQRLGMYERIIWESEHGHQHLAGLLMAMAALDNANTSTRAMRARHQDAYTGGSLFDLGLRQGFDTGMRQAFALARSEVRKAIEAHRREAGIPDAGHGPTMDLRNTSGEVRRQLQMF